MLKTFLKIFAWTIGLALLLTLLLAAAFYQADIPVQDLRDRYATEASHFLPLEGMEVHYRDEGNPQDSLPLVLLHGTSASLLTWDRMAGLLLPAKRIIRFDLPGFGLTGPHPQQDYSIEAYVSFVDQVLTALKVDSCVLAGNSLGGNIAWSYALVHPGKVKQLVLMDATGYPRKKITGSLGFALAQVPVLREVLTVITPRPLIRKSLEDAYSDKSKVSDALVDQYYDLLCYPGSRRALLTRLNLSYRDQSARIAEIHTPTLLIWGDQDQLVPVSEAYRFQADLPQDSLVILENVGHVPMEEVPEVVAPMMQRLMQARSR